MTRAAHAALSLALVLVPATVAATASAGAAVPARHAVASATRPAGYPANRAAARREARHLLALVELPAGHDRLARAPKALRSAASTPSGALVDRVRYYRVGLPFRATSHWIRRHRPAGLSDAGSSSWGRVKPGTHHIGRVLGRGVEFDGRDTAAYVQPELQVEFVRGGHGGTLWRVDGIAQPLDPRPVPDRGRAHRIRVTTGSGCPAADRRWRDVRNPGARLDHHMLPPGRPDAVLLCAYRGDDGRHPMTLRAHRRFGGHVATALARTASAVSLAHVDGAIYSCPLGTGGRQLAVFAYPDRPDVALLVTDDGCLSLDNGHIFSGTWPYRLERSISRELRSG